MALAMGAGCVQEVNRVDLGKTPEPLANVAAAHALERLTPSGALIVDDRPIISFLAHRRVVGPLVDLAKLRFETGSLMDDALIRELTRARAVVVSRSLSERPRVLDAINRQFRLHYDSGGVRIYTRAN